MVVAGTLAKKATEVATTDKALRESDRGRHYGQGTAVYWVSRDGHSVADHQALYSTGPA